MTAGTLIGALLQVVAIAVVGWCASELLFNIALKDRFPDRGLPERALGAITGFVLFAVTLMVGNVITGGAVFGIRAVVPVTALVLLSVSRRRVSRPHGVEWLKLLPLVAVLVAIYVTPAIASGSGVRTGDPPWHLGWTEQLLAGEAIPTGPAPQYGRNAYPWGWHAILATTTRLVPGTTPLVAHEALHLVFVLALPLAAACIARRIDLRSGWWAAGAVSLIGGFGWVMLERPDFVTSPREARYGADLVVASPNSVYELMPSAAPREFALLVLAAAAMFIAWAVTTRDRRAEMGAAVVVGLVGLVSVPLFVSALIWYVAAFLATRRPLRTTALGVFVALVVFGFWAGPVVADFIRYGGFVNITPVLGKEWSLPTALGAWGLLLPGAALGLLLVTKTKTPAARAFVAFAGSTLLLVGASIARGVFDWSLAGNATLLHQGRVWPPAHLLGGALGGIAAARLFFWLRARKRALAVVATAVVLAVGGASPVLASQRMREILVDRADGFVYSGPDVASDSFAGRAARFLGPDDIVQVQGPHDLAFLLFQLSGCRLAHYDHPQFPNNDLRIRYTDLARSWDEKVAGEGFRADYLALPAATGPGQNYIVTGDYKGERWVLIKLSG
ncbi:MAG: hypothetical protein ACRDKT_08745 [Actinomycetota bacterium]